MNLPESPQLKANYILDLFPRLQEEARNLFTDTSVRLEERMRLLSIFGEPTWDTSLDTYLEHTSSEKLVKSLNLEDLSEEEKELAENLSVELFKAANNSVESFWNRHATYETDWLIEIAISAFWDKIYDKDKDLSYANPIVEKLIDEFIKQLQIGFLNKGVKSIEYDW